MAAGPVARSRAQIPLRLCFVFGFVPVFVRRASFLLPVLRCRKKFSLHSVYLDCGCNVSVALQSSLFLFVMDTLI